MFIRNGQALGSVLHSAAPRAEPEPKKASRKAKAATVKKAAAAPEPVKKPAEKFMYSVPDKPAEVVDLADDLQVKEESDGGDTAGA